jgi:hypothetical protein
LILYGPRKRSLFFFSHITMNYILLSDRQNIVSGIVIEDEVSTVAALTGYADRAFLYPTPVEPGQHVPADATCIHDKTGNGMNYTAEEIRTGAALLPKGLTASE